MKRYFILSNDLADRWEIDPHHLQFAVRSDIITPFHTDDGTAFDWLEVVAHELRADLPHIPERLRTIHTANWLGMYGHWVDQYTSETLERIVWQCGTSPKLFEVLDLYREATTGETNG
ncbi:hypothetical protein M0534_00845 [Methylonatrum kenyense]|uniref:hypothetical protein n=1 Tax=Methylonatrum kenyense TaxID=455253 RepID=UPI0020BF4818|nr:hypothetical protein [Methylonatrum kenyense]MCK8514879.1 hypothetical protein [Methylonatrum kenyense]